MPKCLNLCGDKYSTCFMLPHEALNRSRAKQYLEKTNMSHEGGDVLFAALQTFVELKLSAITESQDPEWNSIFGESNEPLVFRVACELNLPFWQVGFTKLGENPLRDLVEMEGKMFK